MRAQQTGSDGRFFVKGTQRGRYHIIARKEGMVTETLDVDVTSDDAISEYVMTLRDAGTGALESYAFSLTDGEPLREAWCRVYTEQGVFITPPETRRDHRGLLRFADLPAGKYRTETGWWGFSSGFQDIEIKPGETTVIEDVLYESGSFRWTLHDSTGSPLVGVPCTVEPLESESIESTQTSMTDAQEMRGAVHGKPVAACKRSRVCESGWRGRHLLQRKGHPSPRPPSAHESENAMIDTLHSETKLCRE